MPEFLGGLIEHRHRRMAGGENLAPRAGEGPEQMDGTALGVHVQHDLDQGGEPGSEPPDIGKLL